MNHGKIVYADNDEQTVISAEMQGEPRPPMPEQHFKALVRLAYAALYAVAQVAALWIVGKIALIGLLPAFIVALIVAID